MLRFGGTLTLDGIVVYLAYNLDKVLLGRWWGAQALGLYGRAYQLVNLPTGNLNNAVGEVAFPALSRVLYRRSGPPETVLPQGLLAGPGTDCADHRLLVRCLPTI